MTQASVISLFAVLVSIFVGCVPTTIHPLYRPADLLQDPALLGEWKTSGGDSKDHWKFSAGTNKTYNLEIRSDEQALMCVAHLFRIGEERFLDVFPEEHALGAKLESNPYNIMLVPGHLFFRVQAIEPKLRMSNMDMDWLKELLKREPKAAAHVLLPDGQVVLTGETEALQAFVQAHLKESAAWSPMYEEGLVKVPAK